MKLKCLDKKWKKEYSIALVLICFFGGLFCIFGVQQFPDTNTYIHMHSDREPLYPLLLWLCRSLFGEFYLTVVAVAQNVFAIFTGYLLIEYISRQFQLKWFGITCVIGLALAPHVLTPVTSASHMVLTNSILSEGITFSLYYLFVYYILRMIWETKGGVVNSLLGLLVAFLNSLARGQMMCMLLAWGCVAGFCVIRKKKWKLLLLVIIGVIGSFGVRSLTVKSYNYIVNGSFVGNSGGGTTILTNIMYSAREEDGVDLEEAHRKQLFLDIFLRAQDAELNEQFADKGMINQALYHEDTHDLLKFDYVEKYLTWYVSDRMNEVGADREVVIDKTAMDMAKQIIVHSFPRWLYVYFCVAVSGFIRTVAVVHPWLNIYAVFVYLMTTSSTIYMVILSRRKRESNHNRIEEQKKAIEFMVLAMLLICANVLATSMTIMCLSRYMIYNLPIFYMAVFILLKEIGMLRRQKERKHGI